MFFLMIQFKCMYVDVGICVCNKYEKRVMFFIANSSSLKYLNKGEWL